MAPVRSAKVSKKIGGAQATLNFRKTKSNSGPSSLAKGEKLNSRAGSPVLKKGSSLKNVIRNSDSDTSSSDEDEPDLPPSIVSATKQMGKVQPHSAAPVPNTPRQDLNLRKYNKLFGLSKEMVDGLQFIHDSDQNKIHHILRTFDLSYQYGPCIGMTRLERWMRAKEMGLKPPMEIKEILETKQGVEETSYRECVFFEEV